MVKAYYRYEHALQFGVIASPSCNVCCDDEGKHLYAGALDNVKKWNIRTGEMVRRPRPSACLLSTRTGAARVLCTAWSQI